MSLSDFNPDSDLPDLDRIDVTPLLHMPSDELQSMFADLKPGSGEAVSVARVLHSLASFLTGERLAADETRLEFDVEPEQASRRAVELIELADALDGISDARKGAEQ